MIVNENETSSILISKYLFNTHRMAVAKNGCPALQRKIYQISKLQRLKLIKLSKSCDQQHLHQ